MSRDLPGELLNECTLAATLPWPGKSARRLEQIYRIAERRCYWGVAIVAVSLLGAQYHQLGLKERLLKNRRLFQRIEPLYLRERQRRKHRKDSAPAIPWPKRKNNELFRPESSRARARVDVAIARAIRVEPASARVRELDRLKRLAIHSGWNWEAFLAALFKLGALSLTRGGELRLSSAKRETRTLGKLNEVQRMLANEGNPIVTELRRWQEIGLRAIRARMRNATRRKRNSR